MERDRRAGDAMIPPNGMTAGCRYTIDDAGDTAVAVAKLLVAYCLSRTTGPPAGGIHGARHPVGAVGGVG
jgi:hypothetical protein